MKALSLTQPFATLVAIQAKRLETRSWATRYRGPLVIHAAKGFPRWALELCFEEPFVSALRAGGIVTPGDLPRGALLATTELTGCFPTPGEAVPWREFFGGFRLPPDEPELSFGDYGPGRHAWRLEDVRQLPEPIPYRGQLGLFDVDLASLERLEVRE